MRRIPLVVPRGYLLAVLLTAAAAVLRLALADFLGDANPFFAFVLAVLLVGRFGGIGPGLFATVLGALVGMYLFIPQTFTLWDKTSSEMRRVGVFCMIGVGTSWVCGGLHAAKRRIEDRQKELEHEVRRRLHAEEQIRSIVENVIDGIITIDACAIVRSFNSAAEKLFGYASDEVIGRNMKMLMPEPYYSEHDGYVTNFIKTGRAKIIGIGREVVGRRKDGSTFPMDLAVSEFRFSEQQYFTGIVRDITERRRAEEALKDADRSKDEFLATLAHELRNPLAPISYATHILQSTCPPDSESQWCRDVIDRQVRHMARLLEDLLDISRITRNRLELRKEQLDLNSVLESAIETSRPLIEAGGQQFTFTRSPEPLPLDADPLRLTQVFSNLLNNAAKYTDRGGRIRVVCERQGSDAVVSVEDTGIGIAAAVLPRIFEMFSQATPALSSANGGLGIGLALARKLIEMHGGTIGARSSGPGEGSEFIVRLPVSLTSRVSGPIELAPAEFAKSSTSRRLLIADDYEVIAQCLAMMLRNEGHEVQIALDGEQAVKAMETLRPDMALLDIGMPKLNGYDVARHTRQQPWGKDMVLVAMTGWGREVDKLRTQEAGFDHHLVKPVQPAVLMKLLAELHPTRV